MKTHVLKRKCMDCANGHFVSETPYVGECRKNPPRSFIDASKPGRFFVSVRYDDWCGQFQLSKDHDGALENMRKLSPHLDVSEKRDLVSRLQREGKTNEQIELLASIYCDAPNDIETLDKLSEVCGGNHTDAFLNICEKILVKRPYDAELAIRSAEALWRVSQNSEQADNGKILKAFVKAFDVAGENAVARIETFIGEQDYPLLAELYQYALNIFPEDVRMMEKIAHAFWRMSQKGRNEEPLVKSIEWNKKASDRGSAEAAYSLAWTYRHGTGVEENEEKFWDFLQLSADRGHEKALKRVAEKPV